MYRQNTPRKSINMNITNDFEPISVHLPQTEMSNGDVIQRLARPLQFPSVISADQSPQIEPTPIDPNRMIPVEKIPLSAAPWHSDKTFLASLRDLLKEETNQPCFSFPTSGKFNFPSKSDLIRSRETSDTSAMDNESSSGGSVPSASQSGFLRLNQLEQWNQRFKELVAFREEFCHCLVPLNWPNNPSLAHWVKRQRHQHRVKIEGKHSTLTEKRQKALEDLGFVWDSHAAGWEERWKELEDFKNRHGHCRVPKKYSRNPQLAVWVKCQRRQFKLYSQGEISNMTKERIEKLSHLGFIFSPRLKKYITTTNSL